MNDFTASTPSTLLPFLGVLRIAGPDALAFLQGQVSNDLRQLADGRTQLAAYCTPQGRVIAIMRLRMDGNGIHALLPTELLASVSALLRRFVLRSKVQLRVAAELQVGWHRDDAVPDSIHADGRDVVRTVSDNVANDVVAFDYAPGRRVLAATPDEWRTIAGAQAMQAHACAHEDWLAIDIADGLPQILAVTSGAFVPQMLNLDLLGALSFSKGCYTGQEIVARTQHLGRIKRRLLRYRLAAGPAPAPLAGLYRDATKVAEVVMSAGRDGGVELLAVTNLAARDLPIHTEDGRLAEPLELPYRIASPDQAEGPA